MGERGGGKKERKDMINDDTSCSSEFDLVLGLELELDFIGMDALGGASTSLVWNKVYILEYGQMQTQTYLSIYNGKNQARL
jgi:hypothetical protein